MPAPNRRHTSSAADTPTLVTASTLEDLVGLAEVFLTDMNDSFCLLDNQGVIRYQNAASCSLWGHNIGKTCEEVCQLRAIHCDTCSTHLSLLDGQHRTTEMILRSAQGERYMEVNTAPITSPDGEIIAVLSTHRDITDRKLTEKGKERLIQELQTALSTVKQLSGLLSICSCCKKIRNDNGQWVPLESFIRSHADVEFRQCLCDNCTFLPQKGPSQEK